MSAELYSLTEKFFAEQNVKKMLEDHMEAVQEYAIVYKKQQEEEQQRQLQAARLAEQTKKKSSSSSVGIWIAASLVTIAAGAGAYYIYKHVYSTGGVATVPAPVQKAQKAVAAAAQAITSKKK